MPYPRKSGEGVVPVAHPSSRHRREGVAGMDVSEECHAVTLRFIRTCRSTKLPQVEGAEQTGVAAAESGGG